MTKQEEESLGFESSLSLSYSPSSSNSAVMDLERSVRVVLGALLGGGGAVEKRYGVEEEVKGNENPLALRLRALLASPRWPVHPIFPALTWSNSGGVDDSHLVGTLFRKPSFFIFCSLAFKAVSLFQQLSGF